jgi:hypothetical protein
VPILIRNSNPKIQTNFRYLGSVSKACHYPKLSLEHGKL